MIKASFPDYPVSSGRMSKLLLWAASKLSNDAAGLYDMWGAVIHTDNSPSKQIFGIEYTDPQQTCDDLVNYMISAEHIPNK